MGTELVHGGLMHQIAAVLFGVALLHTFGAKFFETLAHRHPQHAGLFHLLGEVEVVFGFWAFVLIATMALVTGTQEAIAYAESRQYTEPLFVFVVMVVAASRPVLEAVRQLLGTVARAVPLPTPMVLVWLGLAVVPTMGSLITEPAAMTLAPAEITSSSESAVLAEERMSTSTVARPCQGSSSWRTMSSSCRAVEGQCTRRRSSPTT